MARRGTVAAVVTTVGSLALVAAAAVGSALVGQARAVTSADAARPVVAAPGALTAVSTVPTQIVLAWPAVAGADGYRVSRSGRGQTEATIFEGKVANFARDPGMCLGAMSCWFRNDAVSLTELYSYRVSTIFPGPIYSAPGSPVTARSAPFLPPANLTHAVVPSPLKPGHLQVTVSWIAVAGAEGYWVVPTTPGITATTVRTTSVRFDPLPPKATYGLCVSAIYPLNIRNDAIRTCIKVTL